MTQKQAAILEAAARLLKPGGRLVYATCSLLAEENDAIVQGFLAANVGFRLLPASEILGRQGVEIEGEMLRLLPHRQATDGFFAAALERVA